MRKPTEPESHRARIDLIEGRYPEGMRSRCAVCKTVTEVTDGRFVTGNDVGTGPTQLFVCSDCWSKLSEAA